MPENVSVAPPVTEMTASSTTGPPSSPTSSPSSPPSPPSTPVQPPPGQYVFIKVINILFLFFHS